MTANLPIGIDEARSRLPFLSHDVEPERLGGLTNLNYKIGSFVLRIPGQGTHEYIDRQAESVAAKSASEAGVNVELIHFDAADGLMVTRFLDRAVTMSPELFRDLTSVERAGRALRRLHTCAAPFSTDFALFEMIDEYKSLLAAKQAVLPDGYDEAEGIANRARSALAASPTSLAPCHCDPLCENFLDTGTEMYIIDYEYAGNNDPMWDLGDLSVEGDFTAEMDAALMFAYFEGQPPQVDAARMLIYKALCDLLWTLWGVIQHINSNPADDFWAYSVGRFERCKRLMASEAFGTSLDLLSSHGVHIANTER